MPPIPLLLALLLAGCAPEDARDAAAENAVQWVYDIYPGVPDVEYTVTCHAQGSGLGSASCAVRIGAEERPLRLRCSTTPGGSCALLADCPED